MDKRGKGILSSKSETLRRIGPLLHKFTILGESIKKIANIFMNSPQNQNGLGICARIKNKIEKIPLIAISACKIHIRG